MLIPQSVVLYSSVMLHFFSYRMSISIHDKQYSQDWLNDVLLDVRDCDLILDGVSFTSCVVYVNESIISFRKSAVK